MASQQGNISILGQGIKTRSVGNNTCEMEVDSTFVIKPKKKKHRHRRKKSKNADSIQTSEMIETGLITPAQEIITEEETSELIKEVECGHMLLRNGQMTQPHGKHAGDEMKRSQRKEKQTEEGKKPKQGRVVIPDQDIGNGRKTQPPGNHAGDETKNRLTSRHSQTNNGQRSKKQNAVTPTHEIVTGHETNDVVKETKFMQIHSKNGQRTQPPGNQADDHTENSLTSNHKQNKNWQKSKKQKAFTPIHEISTEHDTSDLVKEMKFRQIHSRNERTTQPLWNQKSKKEKAVTPTHETITEHKADDSVKETKFRLIHSPSGRKTQPPGNQAGDHTENSLPSNHKQNKNWQKSKKQKAFTPIHEISTEHDTSDLVKEMKFRQIHSRNERTTQPLWNQKSKKEKAVTPTHETITEHKADDSVKETKFRLIHSPSGRKTQPPGNQAGDHTENSLPSNYKQTKNWQKSKKQKAFTPTHEISTEHDTSDLVKEMKFRQIHSRNERTTQPLGNNKSQKEKVVTQTHEIITEHETNDLVKEVKFRQMCSPSGSKTQPPGNQTGDHTENSLNTDNKQTKNGQKSQEEKAVTPTYEISRPARHNTTVLVKDMKFRQIDSRNERTAQPLGNQKSQKEKAVTPTHEIITEHEANDVIKDMKFKKMCSPSGRKTQPPGKRAVFEMSSSLTSNKKQNENQRRRLKEKNAIYQRLETWSCNKIPDYLVWSISKGLRLLISLTSQASIPQDWYRLLVLILARASQAENQKEETRDVFEVLGQSEFLGKHLFDYLDNTQIKNQSMKDGLEFFFNIIDIIQLVLETDPSFSRNCPDIVHSLADVVKIILPLNVQDAVNTRLAVVIKKCIDVSKNLQEPKTALTRPRQRTSDRSKTIIPNWSIGLTTGFQFNCRPSVRCGTPETDDTDLDDLMADKLEEEDIHLLSVAQKVDSSWKQNKHKKEHWGDRNYPGERQFHTRKGNREQRDFTYW